MRRSTRLCQSPTLRTSGIVTNLPDWARASGMPLLPARIRVTPSDFEVAELIEVEFSGDGEHDWLWIEKTGANTAWVAERLASHAGVPARDVGYSGLKDRHAVTRQWFSVRRASGEGTDWTAVEIEGVNIIDVQRHFRKLKRGTHRGNAFRIAVRSEQLRDHAADITTRLETIAAQGVPNYFGEQRFGRNGSNIELGEALLSGRRLSRSKRSIGISALRSLDFNNQLSERVGHGTWNQLLPGDTANLDGTRSVFPVDAVTEDLRQRCAELDIHPSGSLPAIESLRVESSWRPFRAPLSDLQWRFEDDALWLEFSLPSGSFATAVLREVVLVGNS